jgi:DNA-binding transcriptional regulator YiaG
MNASEIVHKIRLELCWDQAEFGAYLGVTKQSISNWEVGKRIPKMRHKRKMIELAKNNKIKIPLFGDD